MKKVRSFKTGQKCFIAVVLALLLVTVYFAFQFNKDIKAAKKRFSTYSAKAASIETSFGKMSYIDEGSGEAIISCHGICGGYNQAYDTLADKTDSYRVLAPSRFGYPGSDMPENATIEMQATAYKELLDQLGIEKAYILSTSAGATSAFKFAFMYPERTKGLILYCSGYPRLEAPEKEIKQAGPPAFMCSDLAMWLLSPLFQPIMGMDKSTIHSIMPMEGKKEGIVFDGEVTNTVMYNDYKEYDLSKLEVPVLMLHAKDDKLAPFDGVAPWTERIPNCTYVFFESGGHLMTGNSDAVNQALDDFIDKTR